MNAFVAKQIADSEVLEAEWRRIAANQTDEKAKASALETAERLKTSRKKLETLE